MSLEMYSNEKLRALAEEKKIFGGGLRRVGEVQEVIGPEVVEADVLTILGSERGLWDEMGYSKEPSERIIDYDFSRECYNLLCDLWYQDLDNGYPLLVKLILHLKHGIRRTGTGTLQQIYWLANSPGWFTEEKGEPIFLCRLETLRRAVAAVLADRGCEVQLGHV